MDHLCSGGCGHHRGNAGVAKEVEDLGLGILHGPDLLLKPEPLGCHLRKRPHVTGAGGQAEAYL